MQLAPLDSYRDENGFLPLPDLPSTPHEKPVIENTRTKTNRVQSKRLASSDSSTPSNRPLLRVNTRVYVEFPSSALQEAPVDQSKSHSRSAPTISRSSKSELSPKKSTRTITVQKKMSQELIPLLTDSFESQQADMHAERKVEKSNRSHGFSVEHKAQVSISMYEIDKGGRPQDTFTKKTDEALQSIDRLSQTILQLNKTLNSPRGNSICQRIEDEKNVQQLGDLFNEQWMETTGKVNDFIEEYQQVSNPCSPLSTPRERYFSRKNSTLEAYSQEPLPINLRKSFSQEASFYTKHSAMRSAIKPLLNACLVDIHRLNDPSTMRQIIGLLNIDKTVDSDFSILMQYLQFLKGLANALNDFPQEPSECLSATQHKILKDFWKHLNNSKELKQADTKDDQLTKYCQESVSLLNTAIDSLDQAIKTHFHTSIHDKKGLHSQLCEETHHILFTQKDYLLDINVLRAFKGGYLHLNSNKMKKPSRSKQHSLPHSNKQNSRIKQVPPILNHLKTLMEFLHRHLTPKIKLEHVQKWFSTSSDKTMTKDEVLTQFKEHYERMHAEWIQEKNLDISIESIDTVLNQFPIYKVVILLGLFNQEFLKGIPGKILELHKHLTNNVSSSPIKTSPLPDDQSKEIHIEFTKNTLSFKAMRIGELELDPKCKLITISNMHAPLDKLGRLNISYELFIEMPDHDLTPQASQQLEEIQMIAQIMGLNVRVKSKY